MQGGVPLCVSKPPAAVPAGAAHQPMGATLYWLEPSGCHSHRLANWRGLNFAGNWKALPRELPVMSGHGSVGTGVHRTAAPDRRWGALGVPGWPVPGSGRKPGRDRREDFWQISGRVSAETGIIGGSAKLSLSDSSHLTAEAPAGKLGAELLNFNTHKDCSWHVR